MAHKSYNVARFLSNQGRMFPDACAVRVPTSEGKYMDLTYAELESGTSAVAEAFLSAGISRGSRVLLMVRPGLELIESVFALFKIGAVPIVIDPGMGLGSFLKCVQRSKPEALVGIGMAHVLRMIFFPYFRFIRYRFWVSARKFRRLTKLNRPSLEPITAANDELAAILFTSGSTGPPKGVCYEHGMFEAQIRLLKDYYKIAPGEVDLTMLPVFALMNPAFGMTTVVPEMNPSKPATVDPAKIVQSIQVCQVTQSFGSPVLWAKLAHYCKEKDIQLKTLKRILVAGAPVAPSVLRDLKEVAPLASIHTPYGATEILPVASINATNVLSETWELTESGKGTCVGLPFPGVRIKIIKNTEEVIEDINDAEELPANAIGEVIVSGPTVTRRYDNLEKKTLLAKIQDGEMYWHRMGDLGYLDDQGRLWFCGRKAERVVFEDSIYYTDCCEGPCNCHPKVRRSALISSSRGPALVIEPQDGHFPKTKACACDFAREIKTSLQGSPGESIDAFYFSRHLPVDVRHNAKIHRRTLAKDLGGRPAISGS